MNFAEFEFAQPIWFILLLVPVIVLFMRFSKQPRNNLRVKNFADAHLLPHLLVDSTVTKKRDFNFSWLLIWVLGILALAGPRWDYEEQEVLKKNSNLMILLDLSDSMRVKDLPHARFEQALQDIEELLNHEQMIFIGLTVFAGIPHLVSPMTDDYQTLRHLLYEINMDLLPVQGSRLTLALSEMNKWFEDELDKSAQHVLLISDGEFETSDLKQSIQFLQQAHFHLHTLGVGTVQGKEIELPDGSWQKNEQGETVISKLNETTLQQLASASKGLYHYASYRNDDTQAILKAVQGQLNNQTTTSTVQKLWHERFYLLVALMMVVFLVKLRPNN